MLQGLSRSITHVLENHSDAKQLLVQLSHHTLELHLIIDSSVPFEKHTGTFRYKADGNQEATTRALIFLRGEL